MVTEDGDEGDCYVGFCSVGAPYAGFVISWGEGEERRRSGRGASMVEDVLSG